MLIGIMGKMGAGKTLSASILASYLSRATGAPLYANYALRGATRMKTMQDIFGLNSAILVFDEMWLTMDSRQWKDNVFLTRWINQTRKKKMIVFYTTQHIRQIEMRARNATDILIYCENTGDGHWLQFIDWQYRELGRKYLLQHPKRFYPLYDTFEVLEPLKTSNRGHYRLKGGPEASDYGDPF